MNASFDINTGQLTFKVTATERRATAIESLVADYIGDGLRLGENINEGSFRELRDRVAGLQSLGRTDRWTRAINKWESTVAFAVITFADIMDSDGTWSVWDAKRSDFTSNGQAEFDRLMVWAVLQGSVYATNGN